MRVVGGEGEQGLDLGVLRKGPGRLGVDGGTGGIDAVAALLEVGKAGTDAVGVLEEEVCGVEQHGAVGLFGFDLEARQDGLRKGLPDGEALGGISGDRAKGEVGLNEEHPGAKALEADEAAGVAELTTVEVEVILAGGTGEGLGVDVLSGLGVSAARRRGRQGDFEVEMAGVRVVIESEETGVVFGGRGKGLPGRVRCGRCRRLRGQDGGQSSRSAEREENTRARRHSNVLARDGGRPERLGS